MAEPVVIDLDAIAEKEAVRVSTTGLGELRVTGPTLGAERLLSDYRQRWYSGGARGRVDMLLAYSIRPRVSPAQVAALSETDRARLRLALVEYCDLEGTWRSLYGSHLSTDQRLLFLVEAWMREVVSRAAANAAKMVRPQLDRIGERLRAARAQASVGQRFAKSLSVTRKPAVLGRLKPSLFLSGIDLKGPAVALGLTDNILGRTQPDKTAWRIKPLDVAKPLGYASLRNVLGATVRPSFLTSFGDEMTESIGLPLLTSQATRGFASQFSFLRKDFLGRAGWDFTKTARSMLAGLERHRTWLAEVSEFYGRYSDDRLFHVLDLAGVGWARELGRFERFELIEILLDALEEVFADGEVVAFFDHVVEQAAHLTEGQKGSLQHGLSHLHQREFPKAFPSLLLGFEGALWNHGRAVAVIDANRMLVARPAKEVGSVEQLIKNLAWIEAELRTFLIRAIFGGEGNAWRHGDYEGGERERSLWILVGLASLVDQMGDHRMEEVLSHQLRRYLPNAVARADARRAAIVRADD